MGEPVYSFSEHTFNEIAAQIEPQTIEYYKTKFTPKDLEKYTLSITGTVGAGKSTACESITYILQTAFPGIHLNMFPEYLSVNPDLSNKMLELRLNGIISVCTFQSYIIDIWNLIVRNTPQTPGFRLFERCADDCVLCFANVANKDDQLSDQMLYTMFQRIRELDTAYNLPTYFNGAHFTEIKSSNLNYNLCQIADIIASDISNNIFTRIIGLSVSSFDSERRIKQRNRNGETSYTSAAIQMLNEHYTKLFNLLASHQTLTRFVDIGKLY